MDAGMRSGDRVALLHSTHAQKLRIFLAGMKKSLRQQRCARR